MTVELQVVSVRTVELNCITRMVSTLLTGIRLLMLQTNSDQFTILPKYHWRFSTRYRTTPDSLPSYTHLCVCRCACQRRQWHPTPVLLPGKPHWRRSLVGWSPWGREESDMTEQLHFHFSLLCIGEGNGNPLQCSCLENPRDGVTQSRTRLKWLSSSRYVCVCVCVCVCVEGNGNQRSLVE